MKIFLMTMLLPFLVTASAISARLPYEGIVGNVRVQALSPTLFRTEPVGPMGYEDNTTFMIVNRSAFPDYGWHPLKKFPSHPSPKSPSKPSAEWRQKIMPQNNTKILFPQNNSFKQFILYFPLYCPFLKFI